MAQRSAMVTATLAILHMKGLPDCESRVLTLDDPQSSWGSELLDHEFKFAELKLRGILKTNSSDFKRIEEFLYKVVK